MTGTTRNERFLTLTTESHLPTAGREGTENIFDLTGRYPSDQKLSPLDGSDKPSMLHAPQGKDFFSNRRLPIGEKNTGLYLSQTPLPLCLERAPCFLGRVGGEKLCLVFGRLSFVLHYDSDADGATGTLSGSDPFPKSPSSDGGRGHWPGVSYLSILKILTPSHLRSQLESGPRGVLHS